VITSAVLNDKFPRKPRDPPTPPPDETEMLVGESVDPVEYPLQLSIPNYLRFAYKGFFCVQALIGIHLLTVLHLSNKLSRDYSSQVPISIVSVGLLFLIPQNEPIASGVGRGLAVVFLLHNLILSSLLIYGHMKERACSDVCLCGSFQMVLTVLYLFWALCVMVALRKSGEQGISDRLKTHVINRSQ
jgi:hypothetical protein